MFLQARGSPVTTKVRKLEPRTAPARLDTPTDLPAEGVREISAALNALIADTFALYVKTKNFHWHVSGPHFRTTTSCSMSKASSSRTASIFWPNAHARSAAPRSARSATSRSCSGSRKTTGPTSPPSTCCWSSGTTTSPRSATCARPTRSPTSTRTWPPPAYWRISSTRPKSAAGSCSKPAVRPSVPATSGIAAGNAVGPLARPRPPARTDGGDPPARRRPALYGPPSSAPLVDPAMTPSRDIARLLEIMAALRTRGTGCPWDLQQTFETIAPYTIEEAYEVADAIARGDLDDLRDELGDL